MTDQPGETLSYVGIFERQGVPSDLRSPDNFFFYTVTPRDAPEGGATAHAGAVYAIPRSLSYDNRDRFEGSYDIHENGAMVSEEAEAHSSVYIGPRSVVHGQARLEASTQIGRASIVGRNTYVGENSLIDDRVTIENHVRLERRNTVWAGAVVRAGAHLYANAVVDSNAEVGEGASLGIEAYVSSDSLIMPGASLKDQRSLWRTGTVVYPRKFKRAKRGN